MSTVRQRFQAAGHTAAAWAAITTIPLEREVCIETDTRKIKIGDGVSLYSALDYADNATLGGHVAAYFLDRANHTGTQAASTVSDLTETVQDLVGAMVANGSGITAIYNDGGGTLTIAFTGGISDVSGLTAALAGKEGTIAAGSTGQYWRYDKTWAALTGGVVANTPGGNIAATTVQAAINELDSEKIAATEKGASSGVATLDSGGKVPTSQLPALAITSTSVVNSQAAQLALTAQEGDVAVRTDLNKTYIHNSGSAGTMADWQEMLTPTDTVISVNGMTGAVTVTTITGNAGTATALQTSRNIDGQAFNGTADITVIAPGTHAATSKATPVDADELPLVDSAASNVLKKLTWANLKATLKTYFDTLYLGISATAAKATQLATARNIAGNAFDGTSNISINDTDLSGAAWTAYTPAFILPGGGAFTSAAATGRHKKVGKTVFFSLKVTITTAGTAAGYINVQLPFASASTGYDQSASGYEEALANNVAVTGRISNNSSILTLYKYDGTTIIGTGAVIIISGCYEAA